MSYILGYLWLKKLQITFLPVFMLLLFFSFSNFINADFTNNLWFLNTPLKHIGDNEKSPTQTPYPPPFSPLSPLTNVDLLC